MDGSLEVSSLDLNSCLGIRSGTLQWEQNGKAFEKAKSAKLSTDGKVLQLMLINSENKQSLQTIRLDERIGNIDGTLTFVDESTTLEDGADFGSDEEEDESEDIEFSLSYLERVERAAEWALRALKMEMDWFALVRIGDTLVEEEPDAAIEYLHRSNPPKEDIYREVSLALAYAVKENFEGAIKSFENVQRIMKQETSTSSKASPSEAKFELDYEQHAQVIDLFTCLTRTADYYILLGIGSRAIELMLEALSLKPWACKCRWSLINLLWKNDQIERAKDVFRSWTEDEASALQSPTAFLERLIKDGELKTELLPIVYASRGTDLYKDILGIFEKAAIGEDSSRHDADVCNLLYAYGLIIAANKESEAIDVAKKTWADAFKVGRDIGGDSVEWSARLACMCHFDQVKKDFESLVAPTSEDISIMMDGFTSLISQYEMPSQRYERISARVTGYIACLGRVTGQLDRSKDTLRPDVADAINILSDDDIYNDEQGIWLLMEALAKYGDCEGVFTALSLLDRTVLRSRIEAEANDEDDNVSAASQDKVDEASRSLNLTCEYCEESCNTSDTDENTAKDIWLCRYCPNLSFCSQCRELLLTGKMERFLCNPEHEFLHLKHPEYELYEIEGDNVRIEWHWETIEVDGSAEREGQRIKKEVRTGGRMVTLQEWLDILKKEWKINTTVKIEGKVQQ